jgi:hypothetical protein
MSHLSGRTTIVVGASRGLGRGVAAAFAETGAPVVAVSRTATALAEPAGGDGTIEPEVADAADATAASSRLLRAGGPSDEHAGVSTEVANECRARLAEAAPMKRFGTPPRSPVWTLTEGQCTFAPHPREQRTSGVASVMTPTATANIAHLDFMDLAQEQYSFGNRAYRRFCETIKDAPLDPNGILSPGEQGIWPRPLRKR